MFEYRFQWAKCNLQQKTHYILIDVSERDLLLTRHKIDVKENITL